MSVIANLIVSEIIEAYLADNRVLKYFYSQLYGSFNPDITGYTLIFLKPPEFSAAEYANNIKLGEASSMSSLLSTLNVTSPTIRTLEDFSKSFPFLATEFTPPQTQIQNSQVATRTGSLPYAADVHESETLSISFLESSPLTIYKFHLLWIEYIRDLLKGSIEPNEKYLDIDSEYYGVQDYLASAYVVKYIPDMKTITYIGKCVGIYPLTLPSKELIGTRTNNEIGVIPFEYSCTAYREYVDGLDLNTWILDEFKNDIEKSYGESIFSTISNALSNLGTSISNTYQSTINKVQMGSGLAP